MRVYEENHLGKREGKNLIRFQMKDTCGEVNIYYIVNFA